MTYQDLFVTPIWLILLLLIAYIIRPFVCNKYTRPYFIPGLLVKFMGAIAVGIIYQFYYGYGGDTFMYFKRGSRLIYEAFWVSPLLGFELIFGGNVLTSSNFQYASQIYSFGDPPTYFVVRVAGLFDLFTFHTYSATALFFATASFAGVWAMYHMFCILYPGKEHRLALAVLFVPSVFFWGSGILKDSLTLGALGMLFFAIMKIIHFKRINPVNIALALLSAWILYTIKIYILACFMPAVGLYLYLLNLKKIKSWTIKIIIAPVLSIMAFSIIWYGMAAVVSDNYRYSMDRLTITAEETAAWNYYVSQKEGGAGYTLGDYDFSPAGMARKFIPATFTAMFRPFLWEAGNPVMLLSALENTILMILSFLALSRKKSRELLKSDPILVLCLVFTILFSFSVGVTSYNFGALVRYKIPMMPFLAVSLAILYQNRKPKLLNA